MGRKNNGVMFNCDPCDFSAKWNSHLNKHKHTKHDGVRFKCDLCDNDYSSLADVSNHKRMKHDGVRFDCNQCDADEIAPLFQLSVVIICWAHQILWLDLWVHHKVINNCHSCSRFIYMCIKKLS